MGYRSISEDVISRCDETWKCCLSRFRVYFCIVGTSYKQKYLLTLGDPLEYKANKNEKKSIEVVVKIL